MDQTELLVAKHFELRGLKAVYEPLGRTTIPDFLVEDRIAVEARRLNQHHDAGHGPRALEQAAYPLHHRFKNLLKSFGASDLESWFVSYHFQRPIEPWRTLEQKISKVLREFKEAPVRRALSIQVTDEFEIDLIPASKVHSTYFLLGATSDNDSGGFVVWEISKNLQLCIDEKWKKIERIRSQFEELWLVLVDYIGYGLDEEDQRQLREVPVDHRGWDKIVLIDPLNAGRWFEL